MRRQPRFLLARAQRLVTRERGGRDPGTRQSGTPFGEVRPPDSHWIGPARNLTSSEALGRPAPPARPSDCGRGPPEQPRSLAARLSVQGSTPTGLGAQLRSGRGARLALALPHARRGARPAGTSSPAVRLRAKQPRSLVSAGQHADRSWGTGAIFHWNERSPQLRVE